MLLTSLACYSQPSESDSDVAIREARAKCAREYGNYPARARKEDATGTTWLKIYVDADGVVTKTEVIKSAGSTPAHKLLDRASKTIMECPGFFKRSGEPYTLELSWVWRLS